MPAATIFCGTRLDHARLVEPERVEPHRVLRVEFAPSVVWKLGQRLERIVVPAREAGIDQTLCGLLRLGGAHVGRLEHGPQVTLGGDRMSADERAVAERDTAEILRPWLVRGRAEYHATDFARPQLLRLGREAEKGVDLALGEQLHELPVSVATQLMSV